MKKILVILLATHISLLTTSCGFHPVYGVNKYTAVGAETRMEKIEISTIPDKDGQYLRNALMDRFYRNGYPPTALYTLSIQNLKESLENIDITKDADATRRQIAFTATLILKDNRAQNVALERNLTAITSYNILSSEFATRVTEENARINALDDLARQIEMQISLYFKRNKK